MQFRNQDGRKYMSISKISKCLNSNRSVIDMPHKRCISHIQQAKFKLKLPDASFRTRNDFVMLTLIYIGRSFKNTSYSESSNFFWRENLFLSKIRDWFNGSCEHFCKLPRPTEVENTLSKLRKKTHQRLVLSHDSPQRK